MKKLVLLASTLTLCTILMTGCGDASSNSPANAQKNSDQTQQSADVQNNSTNNQTSTPDTKEEPANKDSGDLGDFHVSIKNYKIVQDYKKKPAILITYEFENKSDKAASFIVSVGTKAFQDGVELSSAMILDDKSYDAEACMKEIKPGAMLTVQNAFVLSSQTSPVEAEVVEAFSFSDEEKLVKTFKIAK